MSRIVLDCSVVFGFIFEDERNPYTLKVAEEIKTKEVVTPSLFVVEFTNVIALQEKRGRWKKSESDKLLDLLSEMPLIIEEVKTIKYSRALLEITRKHNLTSYDANYLAVAMKFNIPLATQDKELAIAAQKEGLYYF